MTPVSIESQRFYPSWAGYKRVVFILVNPAARNPADRKLFPKSYHFLKFWFSVFTHSYNDSLSSICTTLAMFKCRPSLHFPLRFSLSLSSLPHSETGLLLPLFPSPKHAAKISGCVGVFRHCCCRGPLPILQLERHLRHHLASRPSPTGDFLSLK